MKLKAPRPLNTAYMCLQALYMAEACFVAGFAALFLQHRGLDNSSVGVVIACARFVSFAVISRFSAYLDRNKSRLFPIIFGALALQAFAGVVLCAVRGSFFLSAASFVVLSFTYTVLGSFYTNVYTELVYAGYEVNFGLSRGVASGAFTVVSPLAGILAARYSPEIIPFAVMGFAVLMCLTALYIFKTAVPAVPLPAAAEKQSRSVAAFLRGNRGFALFAFAIFLINTAYLAFSSFTINILSSFSGGSRELGLYNGVCSLCEIPFMVFYLRYSKKREDKVFALCLVFFSLKILLALLARSKGVFFLTAILQGLSYGVYTPAVVDFIRRHSAHADSIKSQSVVKLASTLGSIVGVVLTGRMLDSLSLPRVLTVLTLLAASGAVAGIAAVRRISSERPAQ